MCLQVASEINLVSSSLCVIYEWQFSTVFLKSTSQSMCGSMANNMEICVSSLELFYTLFFRDLITLCKGLYLWTCADCINGGWAMLNRGRWKLMDGATLRRWSMEPMAGGVAKIGVGGVPSRNHRWFSLSNLPLIGGFSNIFNCHVWSCAIKMVPPN